MSIVILGAGGAGLSAVKTIVENAPEERLTVVYREDCLPYSPVVLPYYIEGTLSKEDMCLLSGRGMPAGVDLVQGREVCSIDTAGLKVKLDDGRAIGYEKLLICMGASPTLPALPGLEHGCCFVLRTLADADRILAELPGRSGKVAILGAGPVGVELAVALKKRGLGVSLIGRSRIMRRLFDPDFSEAIGDILSKQGVEVLLGQHVEEVRAARPRGAVVVTDQVRIACDMLVVAWGVKPNLGFLQGSGIVTGESGGIAVDEHMRTSVERVYAAGDCVETKDYVTGERGINAIWPEAVAQGRIAALNMIGGDVGYSGGVSRNVVNIFGTPVFSAGSLRGEKKTAVTPFGRIRYTFVERRIVGVQIIGEPPRQGILAPILKGATHPDWLLGVPRPTVESPPTVVSPANDASPATGEGTLTSRRWSSSTSPLAGC